MTPGIKRTTEQILLRIKDIEEDDFFGVGRMRLIEQLPFEHAKTWLSTEISEKEWEPETKSIKELVHSYLEFAWGKANDCRGLSANRSIDHFRALLWLDAIEDLSTTMDALYRYYGKPNLVYISELYGYDWRSQDNNIWTSSGEGGISEEKRNEEIAAVVEMAKKYKERHPEFTP